MLVIVQGISMKKSLICTITAASLACIASTTLASIATATVNFVNTTNCTCQGTYPSFTHCKTSGSGISVQAENQNFSTYGSPVAIGQSGKAPIFSQSGTPSFLISAQQMPLSFEGAKAGATYYVIGNVPMKGFNTFAIATKKQC